MNAQGQKTGVLTVHLYRPFSLEHFFKYIPKTVKAVAVLDKTKEPGALGEPLYLDVKSAFYNQKDWNPTIVGGRCGLGGKDITPSQLVAVFDNLAADEPKDGFTIGIVDDVTGLSLEEKPAPDTAAAGTIACKFWGLGGDGTVGANFIGDGMRDLLDPKLRKQF